MKPHFEQSSVSPANISISLNRPSRIRQAGAVVGLAAVGFIGLSQFGGEIANIEVDQRESGIDVVIEKIRPVYIPCFAAAESSVNSKARFKLNVLGREIGPTGYKSSLRGNFESLACFEGSSITTTVDQKTGQHDILINRAGKKIITEGDLLINTDVEGSIAEAGGGIALLADVVGIDRFSDQIADEKEKLNGSLESATKSALENDCISQLGAKLEDTITEGVLLQADSQGVDRSKVTVRFTGSSDNQSPTSLARNAGQLGFDVAENNLENIRCSVDEAAFEDVEGLTEPALTAEEKSRAKEAL